MVESTCQSHRPARTATYREGYVNGSIAGHHGHNEWKAGADMRQGSIHEQFACNLVACVIDGAPVFDPNTPPTFSFDGHGIDREQSAYVEDIFCAGHFTASLGLRFDHYSLLVHEHAFSPGLGTSWSVAKTGLVLHASYDRTFGTPPFENILVSASVQAQNLNDSALYLALRPSRGNYYEGGSTQSIARHFSLELLPPRYSQYAGRRSAGQHGSQLPHDVQPRPNSGH